MLKISSFALAAAALAFGGLAYPQEYPSKPIQIVLPLQAGSGSDIAVRVVTERMAEILGQGFVVENVPGVGGLIGANRAATARPDGYTLAGLANSVVTILPHIRKAEAKFDPFNDFIPIYGFANVPTFLGVPRDLPASSTQELIRLAKAQPGALNYSSGGPGSPQHLAAEMFQSMAGIKLTHVPYKGATAAAADLAAGRVQVMMISHALAIPYIQDQDRKVKLIAFAGKDRSRAFPDVPTMHEGGVPGYDFASWIALFAIKGTPAAVVAKLRDAAGKALATPGMGERLFKSGLEIWPTPPERLSAVIREDYLRWEKVVADAGIADK